MMPPKTSLCPPINLVALSTTMSTPQSSGRITYGLANVLSHITSRSLSRANFTRGGIAVTLMFGLAIVSKYRIFVFPFIAFFTVSMSLQSTNVVSIPKSVSL